MKNKKKKTRLSRKAVVTDCGPELTQVTIENNHGQYLWFGFSDTRHVPDLFAGTLENKRSIKRLRDWCNEILNGE